MAGQGWQLWSARGMRLLDLLLVAYLVVWLVLGMLIAVDIRRQAELSDQVTRVGAALTDIGESLEVVGGLPLVGGDIGQLADRVLDAGGRRAAAAARTAGSRSSAWGSWSGPPSSPCR